MPKRIMEKTREQMQIESGSQLPLNGRPPLTDLLLQLKQICTTINICLTHLYDAASILESNLRMHDNQSHARKPDYSVKGNSTEKAT